MPYETQPNEIFDALHAMNPNPTGTTSQLHYSLFTKLAARCRTVSPRTPWTFLLKF